MERVWEIVQDSTAWEHDLENVYWRSNLTMHELLTWVGFELDPDEPAYNQVATVTLREAIDPDHFRKAFRTLVRSSDALRTIIENSNGLPQRRILDPGDCTLEYLDFSRHSDPRGQLACLVRTRAGTPFDLTKPLFHAALIKTAADEFVWLLRYHHIVSDGASLSLIIRYMSEFYRSSLEGKLSDVSLPLFQEYVAYERTYRGSKQFQAARDFWDAKLSQKVEPLSFYGIPAETHGRQLRNVLFDFGDARTHQLRERARNQGIFMKTLSVSLFNILSAVAFAFVHRISGNRHLSIGAPFHNRRSQAFARTIGLFMEVHPLRIEIAKHETFLSLIDKIANETVETRRHSQFATASVGQARHAVLINMASYNRRFNDKAVAVDWYLSSPAVALYLSFQNLDAAGTLYLKAGLNASIFTAETAGWALEHFTRVLDAFLDNPEQPIQRIPLVTGAERERVLLGFNRTREEFVWDQTLDQLVQSQAEKAPETIAAVCGDQHISYSELNRRANQLARYLRRLGVGPEVLVGIMLERSVGMVVGLLGILKAGGAYVPLDPTYPHRRLAFMIEDSNIAVLLTQSSLKDRCNSHPQSMPKVQFRTPTVVLLDGQWNTVANESFENLGAEHTGDNLAYVIYTSGSTGRPKGVQVRHRSLQNFLKSMERRPGMCHDDTVLSVTTMSFDIAGLELFLPLVTGARTLLVSRGVAADGTALKEWLEDATVMQATPATWRLLLDAQWTGNPRLTMLCGGDALTPKLAEDLAERGKILWNLYGPTETTIWSTAYPVRRADGESSVPIGRPVANTQVYLLDEGLMPVPVGLIGALLIGGDGIARGYLNQPGLSAEKFVPHPFGEGAGERLYRTGDLGRHRPDGNLEFFGRSDHQVKIRGFRIELGEIEAMLEQHPAIRQSAAITRPPTASQARKDEYRTPNAESHQLVAYVVADGESAPSSSEIQRFLKERLPEHMVPRTFVALNQLPLTPNGKVDRKALRTANGMKTEPTEAYVEPRTETERLLVGVWSEILGIERVGINANFFELGGHSLLATQVLSRVRTKFGVDPPAGVLFQAQTIAVLADLIDTLCWASKTATGDRQSEDDNGDDATF